MNLQERILLLTRAHPPSLPGLRIKETKEVYEGEVTELTPCETENPMGGYGRTISHVVVGLKTAKGTKQLKVSTCSPTLPQDLSAPWGPGQVVSPVCVPASSAPLVRTRHGAVRGCVRTEQGRGQAECTGRRNTQFPVGSQETVR